MADVKAKFLSTILGLAIGDALGYPAEFLAARRFSKRITSFGKKRGGYKIKEG